MIKRTAAVVLAFVALGAAGCGGATTESEPSARGDQLTAEQAAALMSTEAVDRLCYLASDTARSDQLGVAAAGFAAGYNKGRQPGDPRANEVLAAALDRCGG